MGLDDSGSVCVTGYSYGSGTHYDYATIKYRSNGDTAWVKRYNGPGNGDDEAYAIAVDDSGNVYVTGTSYDSITAFDYVTIKYRPNGELAWERRYNGPGNGDDEAHAIGLDDSRNVYVTGHSYGSGAHNYATIKYYPDGATAWVKRYNGPGYSGDSAFAMAVGDSGSVYVTGGSGGSGTGGDYATIKYIPVQFLRGDANADGVTDVGDVVYLINYLFKSGPTPFPLEAGDLNRDGIVDVGDVVYLINYLFKGGPPPPPVGKARGEESPVENKIG